VNGPGKILMLNGARPWGSQAAGCGPGRAGVPASEIGPAGRVPHRPRSRPISSFMISLDPAQIFVTRESAQARDPVLSRHPGLTRLSSSRW
jgi:hypothetical protein